MTSETGKVAFADAKAAIVTDISLHTDDPGETGANEISGGGYARQTPTYEAATYDASGDRGVASLDGPLDFEGPSQETVAAVGYWAGSDFLGADVAPSGDTAFNAEGEFQVVQADVTDE